MEMARKHLAVAVAAVLATSVAAARAPSMVDAAGVAGEYVVTFDSDVDAVAKARKERALGNEVSDVFSEAVEGFVATLDANDIRRLRSDGDVLAVEPNSTIRVAATPGRYIVQLRSGASTFGTASAVGATNVRAYTNAITGFAADLTAEAYDALSADPNVISIEPDVMVQTSDTQLSPASWGLDRIDQRALPLGSSYTYPNRAQGVRAYVIDTGVRASHVQFGGRVAAGYDGVLDGNGTNDCNGHGTHVAGTIAGVTAGVAKAATVVPVRVLGCNGSGWMSVVIAGIDWVIADHEVGQPAVANLSLGGAKSRIMNSAVARGVADGVTFVVAAGNSNADACNASPASEATALTVGASGSSDLRASFSNWGSCLDVFAPGVGIASASHTGDTIMRTLSGTSMAAPHVAGAAALILGGEPSLSPAQVAARVLTGATANALGSVGIGSPNRLLFTGSADAPPPTNTTVDLPGSIPRPANDNFANATLMSGTIGILEQTSTNATREAGEPMHVGFLGSTSVWYRWTAPSDGNLIVATGSTVDRSLNSDFDTLLAIYTGSAIERLSPRASNDDFAPQESQLWSRVALRVTAGTTYMIAVDGFQLASGAVKLSWVFTAITTPLTLSWGLDRLDQRTLPLSGTLTRQSRGQSVSVYVIDTGVFSEHEELRGKVLEGFTTVDDGYDTGDCNGHGTHVAGTIAGQNFGVAPEARIIPVRVLDCKGKGSTADVVEGLEWMIQNHETGNPAVANLSLGGEYSVAINSAVARAVRAGITVVVAAGNDGDEANFVSPASEASAITVGAIDQTDTRASFSNYGPCVDIFAPGKDIHAADISSRSAISQKSGTSMASPHVAGVAALMLSANPSWSTADLEYQLVSSSTRGLVRDAGRDSPNRLLYIGADNVLPEAPSSACVPKRRGANSIPTTTLPSGTTLPTVPPPVDVTTTVHVTSIAPRLESTTTSLVGVTTAAPTTAMPTTTIATEQVQFRASGVGAVEVVQPQATVVRTGSDRVLVRISNARGSVDVLVNGKFVLKTKKRVLLLKSKGIGAKRVTVRASATR